MLSPDTPTNRKANPVFTNPDAYLRAVTRRLAGWATAVVTLVAAGCAIMTAGTPLAAIAAGTLGVAAVACLLPALNWYEIRSGEVRRPRTVELLARPLTYARRQLVNRAVAAALSLTDDQRAALAAAHARVAATRAHRNLVDRVILTAGWAGRLYGDDIDGFGVEALAAVLNGNVDGAYETVLALLAADVAHPTDVAELLAPWSYAGLPVPPAEEQVMA